MERVQRKATKGSRGLQQLPEGQAESRDSAAWRDVIALPGPEGAYRKAGRDFSHGQVATGRGEMVLNWKKVDLD